MSEKFFAVVLAYLDRWNKENSSEDYLIKRLKSRFGYTKTQAKAIVKEWKNEYQKNPASKAVRIYGQIEEIRAIKGQDSLWPGERFKHSFKPSSKAEIYGNPDGSITIRSTTGKKLWKMFNYPEKDYKENPVKKHYYVKKDKIFGDYQVIGGSLVALSGIPTRKIAVKLCNDLNRKKDEENRR